MMESEKLYCFFVNFILDKDGWLEKYFRLPILSFKDILCSCKMELVIA